MPKPTRPLSGVHHVEWVKREGLADFPCPCGSLRRARSCHLVIQGDWLATAPEPLLTGPRTGFAHPGCYAASSNDCSEKLTREHVISAAILRSLEQGKKVRVSGLPWMTAPSADLPVQSMTARILCDRHNNALSPLDDTAAKVQAQLRADQDALNALRDNPGSAAVASSLTLASGPLLELWLLKTVWGAMAGGHLKAGGSKITAMNPEVNLARLANILFRAEPWPDGWGFYVPSYQSRHDDHASDVGLVPLTAQSGELYAASVEFGSVRLHLALGVIAGDINHRPGGVITNSADKTVQRVTAFAWPDIAHAPIILNRP